MQGVVDPYICIKVKKIKIIWVKREMRHLGLRSWFKADKRVLEVTVKSKSIFHLKQAS